MSLPTFTAGTEIKASEMNAAFATIFDMVYPVGSIYMSATLSTTSAVNNALPGTWQAWGAGRVPVGVDASQTEFDTVEETGGEKTHTLTTDEMPAHGHRLVVKGGTEFGDGLSYQSGGSWNGNFTQSSGGSQAHNNLQPYITCYMYKRVS